MGGKTHELFYYEQGKQAGPYVHVKFLPNGAARARWYWAYKLRPRRIRDLEVCVYSVVDKYGEKRSHEEQRAGKRVTIEVTELLMGEPIEERPAGLSYHYGELEEL